MKAYLIRINNEKSTKKKNYISQHVILDLGKKYPFLETNTLYVILNTDYVTFNTTCKQVSNRINLDKFLYLIHNTTKVENSALYFEINTRLIDFNTTRFHFDTIVWKLILHVFSPSWLGIGLIT